MSGRTGGRDCERERDHAAQCQSGAGRRAEGTCQAEARAFAQQHQTRADGDEWVDHGHACHRDLRWAGRVRVLEEPATGHQGGRHSDGVDDDHGDDALRGNVLEAGAHEDGHQPERRACAGGAGEAADPSTPLRPAPHADRRAEHHHTGDEEDCAQFGPGRYAGGGDAARGEAG